MASNTYRAVGTREDVSDIITNISPSDTPLNSRLGRTRAIQVIHEWLEDELGEAGENFKPEGYTYETTDAEPRTRLMNYTQIMDRNVQVTKTQEAVSKYGVRSEIAYQMQKRLKELAFDCEKALLTQDAKELGSMSVARKFGGLPYWIVTNVKAATGGNLTFDLINEMLEMTWIKGGKPSVLLVSPRNKRIISTFTAGHTKFMNGNETRKLTQMISVLETDFGTLQCLTDRFMTNDVIYGLSPEYIKRAFLRNFKTIDLPPTKDMLQKVVNGEWTLEMRAEKAHFKISGLNGVVPAA